MNAEIKQAWLAAVKSGKYEFIVGRLKEEEGKYCPLGVLAELAVEAGVIPPPVKENGQWYYWAGDERMFATLLGSVLNWAGLSRDAASRVWRINDDPSFDRTKDAISTPIEAL